LVLTIGINAFLLRWLEKSNTKLSVIIIIESVFLFVGIQIMIIGKIIGLW
jgi:hypothetical protein